MIKSKKDKVLIYATFSENDIDDGLKKEESIKQYCKDKGYNIVGIVRKPLPYTFFATVTNFVTMMKNNANYDVFDFNKVIVYDIKSIIPGNSELLTILTILKERKIALESIVQGKLAFNPLDKEDILGDDYTFDNYQCDKNKKYFVELPF